MSRSRVRLQILGMATFAGMTATWPAWAQIASLTMTRDEPANAEGLMHVITNDSFLLRVTPQLTEHSQKDCSKLLVFTVDNQEYKPLANNQKNANVLSGGACEYAVSLASGDHYVKATMIGGAHGASKPIRMTFNVHSIDLATFGVPG